MFLYIALVLVIKGGSIFDFPIEEGLHKTAKQKMP